MNKKINNINTYIEEIYNFMVLGFSNRDIYKVMKSEYNFDNKIIKKYIDKANKKFTYKESMTIKENKATERLLNIYKRALEQESYRLALDVQKELNRVQGLTLTSTNKHTITQGDLKKYTALTDQQIEEELLKVKKISYEKDLI